MNAFEEQLIPGTDLPMVVLSPLVPEDYETVAGWLTDDKVRCWLDFGGGRQDLSSRQIIMMLLGRRTHARVFRLPGDQRPLGLVCLNNVDDLMGGTDVWIVRDTSMSLLRDLCRAYSAKTVRDVVLAAGTRILANAFLDLEREVVSSWVVETNTPSIRLHTAVGMRHSGTQRGRHVMAGRRYDRWLFDITLEEFRVRYPLVPSESGRSFGADRTSPWRLITAKDVQGLEATNG